MESTALDVESTVEASHWWFVGRRTILQRVLEKLQCSKHVHVLEVGTGTGSNLRLLRHLDFTNLNGVDLSDDAIRHCKQKRLGNVQKGDICNLPFSASSFDIVLATDVIERVDDDRLALCELWRVLKLGGTAIITVPAFPSLWGLQDEVSHHKRRYRIKTLRKLVKDAGFSVKASHYFNYVLFGPIWAARQIIRMFRIRLDSENQVNTSLLNAILKVIFLCDVATAPWIRPPFGVSIFILAEKTGQSDSIELRQESTISTV